MIFACWTGSGFTSCFGCACGVKWSGLFVLAGFGLLTWAWDSGMRRAAGVRFPVLKSAVADALPAAASLVLVAAIVYVACWSDFLVHHRPADAVRELAR